MRIALLIGLFVFSYSAQSQSLSDDPDITGLCEVFKQKQPRIDKSKRLIALRDMEGDSVVVVIINKRKNVIKKYKGVVSNLPMGLMKRGLLHSTLLLGYTKKNGKKDRLKFSTNDPLTRIYSPCQN